MTPPNTAAATSAPEPRPPCAARWARSASANASACVVLDVAAGRCRASAPDARPPRPRRWSRGPACRRPTRARCCRSRARRPAARQPSSAQVRADRRDHLGDQRRRRRRARERTGRSRGDRRPRRRRCRPSSTPYSPIRNSLPGALTVVSFARRPHRRLHARARPGPGAAIRQSLTPGTARSAAATASASAAAHSALTCGPASMVKKAGVPRGAQRAHARRSRPASPGSSR